MICESASEVQVASDAFSQYNDKETAEFWSAPDGLYASDQVQQRQLMPPAARKQQLAPLTLPYDAIAALLPREIGGPAPAAGPSELQRTSKAKEDMRLPKVCRQLDLVACARAIFAGSANT